jgi:hypothetical protein
MCLQWPPSVWMHSLNFTIDDVTLHSSSWIFMYLAALTVWCSLLAVYFCVHTPQSSCNPTQDNIWIGLFPLPCHTKTTRGKVHSPVTCWELDVFLYKWPCWLGNTSRIKSWTYSKTVDTFCMSANWPNCSPHSKMLKIYKKRSKEWINSMVYLTNLVLLGWSN